MVPLFFWRDLSRTRFLQIHQTGDEDGILVCRILLARKTLVVIRAASEQWLGSFPPTCWLVQVHVYARIHWPPKLVDTAHEMVYLHLSKLIPRQAYTCHQFTHAFRDIHDPSPQHRSMQKLARTHTCGHRLPECMFLNVFVYLKP